MCKTVEVTNPIIATLIRISISGASTDGKQKRNMEQTFGPNKKQQPELKLYQQPRNKVLLNVQGRRVVNVLLNSGSNVIRMSPRFIALWKVPKVQQDVLAAVRDFSGEVVAGMGQAFTKPLKMIIENGHESLI